MSTVDRLVGQLARAQFGAVSRTQLLALGLRPSAIHRRVASGELRTWGPGLYVAAGAAPRFELEVCCAVLQRPASAVALRWAAAWWSLAGFDARNVAKPVDVTSTVHRMSASGANLVQTRRLDPIDVVPMTDQARQAVLLAAQDRRRIARGGNRNVRTLQRRVATETLDPVVDKLVVVPSVTSPERTIIDLARSRRFVDEAQTIERALDDALARHLVSVPSVSAAIDRSFPARSSARMAAFRFLVRRGAGVIAPDSQLEHVALEAFAEWGLPVPERQHALPGRERREGQVDLLFVEARIIVEVDGRDWHLSAQAFDADRRRDRISQLAGYRILRYTWSDFTVHAGRTRRELRAALGVSAA